jgi:hypothetical protein
MRSPEMALRSTRNTVELNALALGTGNTEKCQRAARKGRGKQGRRRDGHRLRSSFLCRWPPLSPPLCAVWADGSWPVFRPRGVSVSRTGAGLLGFVRVSTCVSVNVNTTHPTTGATTLLLPVDRIPQYHTCVRRMTDDALRTHIRDVGCTRRPGFSHRGERSRVVSAGGPRRI